jgi:hypothetical protein
MIRVARWPGDALNRESEDIAAAYRALAERLRGKTGEFILMIQRDAELTRGGVRSMQPLRESFTLGLLKSDKLCFNLQDSRPAWTFPTINSAALADHRFSFEVATHIEQGGMHPQYEFAFFKLLTEEVDLRRHEHPEAARFSLGVDLTGSIVKLDLFVGNAEIDAWCRRPYVSVESAARVALIRRLAKALGANPKGIRAVQQANEVACARITSLLEKQVERLRAAHEAIKSIEDPETGAKVGHEIGTVRQAIQRLLKEAEDAGLDDPFYQRLRAAHPAK